MATQRQYGVPAAVTIAQAILESGWGNSHLASADHNLFGMKGRGPAGSDALPTQEYQNGQWVTTIALFRKYDNFAESIGDHGRLLATSGYYKRAMAAGTDPDGFANALTGVYATDPDYGAKLISLMHEFNLYQYDPAPGAAPVSAAPAPATATPTPTSRARPAPASSPAAPAQPDPSPAPTAPKPRSTPTQRSRPSPRSTPTQRSAPAAARRVRAAHAPVSATLTAAFRPAVTGAAFRPAVTAAALRSGTGRAAIRTPQRAAAPRRATPYVSQIPMPVKNAFVAFAKVPLASAEALYRDVASFAGIGWELLAACDWMECEARPDHSPVYGEKLGTPNPDGTAYRTKSEALEQCARDLVDLARAVYRIDLSDPGDLSVRDLASAFAAFRWGALLKQHHTSAMEFPYSVAGLTGRHLAMHWPAIDEPNAPDKPGTRFRMRFGAVPTVLCLRYPATAA